MVDIHGITKNEIFKIKKQKLNSEYDTEHNTRKEEANLLSREKTKLI